jgi:hypothetical protein
MTRPLAPVPCSLPATPSPRLPARHPPVRRARAAGLALSLLLPVAALAAPDWTTVAAGCSPGSKDAIEFGITNPLDGSVRAGRNPPVRYFCPVHHPSDFTTAPDWNQLKLVARDPNTTGGNVTAKLIRKNRSNGAVGKLGVIASVASTASTAVTTSTAILSEAMDFSRYAYFILLELAPAGDEDDVEAHLLILTRR